MKKSRIGFAVAGATLLVIASVWLAPKLLRRYYHHGLGLVEIAGGLDVPWSIAFLPDGAMLVTERIGRMRRIGLDGRVGEPIAGLPAVAKGGEGGLLAVALAPDFASSRRVYWSYSEPALDGGPGASTALARGRLLDRSATAGATAGPTMTDVEVIFRQPAKLADNRHFGSRLLFDRDGHLLLALGDRMARDDAQRLDSAHGKLLRLMPDGGVPNDNPFQDRPEVLGQIWSYGHRNVQGLAFNPQTGSLWASEHGPSGGDEVNLIKPGANYGWPRVTHGCEYDTCAPIGEGVEPPGIEAPLAWFGPQSVPPSALAFVTSERYPQWKGDLLMGVLHSRALIRMKVDGDRIVERESMWLGKHHRIRDVQQGPDGWIYVAVERPQGAILRLVP